jgi:glycosyltransferase involved in cell wall biosynthesis
MKNNTFDITIDARMIHHSGIGRILREIIFRLADNFKIFLILPPDGVYYAEKYSIDYRVSNIPIYHPSEHFTFFFDSKKAKVFWSPHYNIPLFLYPGAKRVTTICDLNHIEFGSDLSILKRIYSNLTMRLALLFSKAIITISAFTKQEINRYFPGFDKKINDIHLGIKERGTIDIDVVQKKYSLPDNFMLFVGNVKPHKNIKVVLQAMTLLTDDQLTKMPLVIVGKKEGFLTPDLTLSSLLENPRLSSYVHFLGFVDDEDLDSVYSAASMFVFPSLYEGFGFPPLEAMQNYIPILCSDATSLPEVCGNAVEYFDAQDASVLSKKIDAFLKNPPLSNQLKYRYDLHLAKFSWEKCAKKYFEIFESLIISPRNQN